MARKQFLLKYPDGSKKHIGCPERDSLLLDRLIARQSDKEYVYIGQPKTFHSFADLEQLIPALQPKGPIVKYYSGHFIWEFSSKRHRELMETPDAMVLRLAL